MSGDKTWYGTHITQAGRRRNLTYHTVPASVVVVTINDVIVINKTLAGATGVTLPANPTKGDSYIIKDGKGDAGSNNITVSPNTGTIDGAASNTISTNYLAREYIYNGTEWNVI